jgi:SAM-dependent methyltransferase
MTQPFYNEKFYDQLIEGAFKSAEVYLGALFALWSPASIIDLGCGRGAWLAVANRLGIRRLVGIDGGWVAPQELVCPAMEFHSADLNDPVDQLERFDLALSLEVAEHLRPESSEVFIASLTALSNAVVFSAAFTGQPGSNHINTRPHSFWAQRFTARGFHLFDFFRPRFWSDDRVEPWYRQNTFIYVRPDHVLHDALGAAGYVPIHDLHFVDCVHPWFYLEALKQLQPTQI